jgi:cation transport ATPase
MDVDVGGGVRELVWVIAVAAVGLLLAVLAAFTPWYAAVAHGASPHVVELYTPGLAEGAG